MPSLAEAAVDAFDLFMPRPLKWDKQKKWAVGRHLYGLNASDGERLRKIDSSRPTLFRAFQQCKSPVSSSLPELLQHLSSLREAELALQHRKLLLYQNVVDVLVADSDNSNPAFKRDPRYHIC